MQILRQFYMKHQNAIIMYHILMFSRKRFLKIIKKQRFYSPFLHELSNQAFEVRQSSTGDQEISFLSAESSQ